MMIRTTIGAVAMALAMTFGSTAWAEDTVQQAPAAVPADKATGSEKTGGCMPDGSCCGNPACAQAASAADTAGGTAAGGCPCGRMKMKQEKQGTDKPS